jgi:hypothetical protein
VCRTAHEAPWSASAIVGSPEGLGHSSSDHDGCHDYGPQHCLCGLGTEKEEVPGLGLDLDRCRRAGAGPSMRLKPLRSPLASFSSPARPSGLLSLLLKGFGHAEEVKGAIATSDRSSAGGISASSTASA